MLPGGPRRRRLALFSAVPALALLAGLTAGCSGHESTSGTKASPTASSSAGSGSAAEMEKKLDAAESAAAQAEKDTATDK
ncbi:hypothetical protein [Streptomyces sp. NBC_01497]|uniref:hypothetical protein n=1 Tax=Streptomyces sp. NBC_01497 TaxID=2903885 RepID=UPI002E3673B9|nr:hypothetical protein [Streptomyces sp. NBC_01497]